MSVLVKKCVWLLAVILAVSVESQAEPPTNGVRPSNVLGSSEQHASFSFVRPGLTQTAFSFSGPSSHQAFSSSIGDPHLAQKVLPSVAQALTYRNPGLGYTSIGPITSAYAAGSPAPTVYQQQQYDYQQQQQQYQQQQALALAYQQQLQQYQQYQQQQQQQVYSGADYAQQIQAQPVDAATQQSLQQAQLARLLAARLATTQAQATATETSPEQIQLQQQQQQQQTANLLGVAYSAAPSVAHVKVSGNGYKFDF